MDGEGVSQGLGGHHVVNKQDLTIITLNAKVVGARLKKTLVSRNPCNICIIGAMILTARSPSSAKNTAPRVDVDKNSCGVGSLPPSYKRT